MLPPATARFGGEAAAAAAPVAPAPVAPAPVAPAPPKPAVLPAIVAKPFDDDAPPPEPSEPRPAPPLPLLEAARAAPEDVRGTPTSVPLGPSPQRLRGVAPASAGPFDRLGDELATAVLARVPLVAHAALRASCRRANALVTAPAFSAERRVWRLREHGTVLAGGDTAQCWLLVGARARPIAPLGGARTAACATVLANELWVCGGCRCNTYGPDLRTVEVYSAATDSWRAAPAMLAVRRGAVCGVVGGAVVVAGGASTSTAVTAEAYTPGAAGWVALPPMPHAATFATAWVCGGRLYVAGGLDATLAPSRTLQVWDGLSWECRADMPTARHSAAAAVLGARAVVCGGCEPPGVRRGEPRARRRRMEEL